MPGTRWFPGAELSYAEHALRHAAAKPDEIAVVARSQTRDAGHPHRRRAARRGGPCAAGPASPRRRARRPGGRLRAEHPRDARRVPGHGVARRDLVELRPRVRRPLRRRPVRPDRAGGAARRRRLPLRRQGRSTAARRSPRSARSCRAPARRVDRATSATAARRIQWADLLGGGAPGPLGVRAGAVRPSAVRAVQLRAPPACPRPSSTATAASPSSTSRCWPSTRTSAPATASPGSPPPAG